MTQVKTYIVDPAIPDDPGNLTEYRGPGADDPPRFMRRVADPAEQRADVRRSAGNVAHRRVTRYMERIGEKDYATALKVVLHEDPSLARHYLYGDVG